MAAKPFSLGYVGIGLMGGPMTQRLVSLGWSVRAYDIVAERSAAASAAEAARGAQQRAVERARAGGRDARERALAAGAAERCAPLLQAAQEHQGQGEQSLAAGDLVAVSQVAVGFGAGRQIDVAGAGLVGRHERGSELAGLEEDGEARIKQDDPPTRDG